MTAPVPTAITATQTNDEHHQREFERPPGEEFNTGVDLLSGQEVRSLLLAGPPQTTHSDVAVRPFILWGRRLVLLPVLLGVLLVVVQVHDDGCWSVDCLVRSPCGG